jgi:hypothetical protein
MRTSAELRLCRMESGMLKVFQYFLKWHFYFTKITGVFANPKPKMREKLFLFDRHACGINGSNVHPWQERQWPLTVMHTGKLY